ncbi:hypothetical protein NKY44_29825 [Sinorhizobium meliloti]|uniref:hypothetical protein n=1 Tax=Rhizobium meliloti TaxID=382 RepID=UPI003D6590AF
MSSMRGGEGFRVPPHAVGTTRGERKEKARLAANARVSEERPYVHMHSAARYRLLNQAGDTHQVTRPTQD